MGFKGNNSNQKANQPSCSSSENKVIESPKQSFALCLLCGSSVANSSQYISHLYDKHYKQNSQMKAKLLESEVDCSGPDCSMGNESGTDETSQLRHWAIDHQLLEALAPPHVARHLRQAFSQSEEDFR